MAPEWTKAANALADSSVKLAKVDATAHPGLQKEHQIKGFPTIKYFNKGKASDYSGGRTADDIVSWVNKKAGPAAKTITSAAELEVLKEGNDVSVLGVFGSEDSVNARSFLALAADSESTVPFAISSSAAVRSELGLTEDTIVIHRSFDTPRVTLSVAAGFDEATVGTFVAAETTPLIQEFTQESAKKIFSSPVTNHALFFTTKSEGHHTSTMEIFKTVGPEYKGRVLFVNVPNTADNKRVMDYFEIKASDLPAFVVLDMDPEGGSMKKFPFNGDLSVEAVSAHISGFLSGSLKPHLKSEEAAPEDTTGDVVVVKGTTFNELVLNNDKDVFLEFYAPWCGHCKKLSPTWDALGNALKGTNVIVAKMDATANEVDVPGLAVKGFPTIFWLRGDKKSSPVKYEGGRELADLVKYVKENAYNKVGDVHHAGDGHDHDHDDEL